MTTYPLTLDRVTCRLSDGRTVFSELSFTFDPVRTGLVGANGVGKSVLARILAGQRQPSSGRCRSEGRVTLLPALSGTVQGSVGELAGVAEVLAALARISAGSVDPADFATVDDRWDLRERLQQQWRQQGLPDDLDPEQPAARLSGGQAMQVALSGAWASGADWLILDEPSNHLDARRRSELETQLSRWRGGLIVISHDRALLDHMECIVELDGGGLHRFGGGYADFVQAKATQAAAAQAQLDHARNAHRQQQRQAREQHERAQQRHSRGERSARDANQAPLLLGLQKQRAQASAGRNAQLQQQRLAGSAERLRTAAASVGRAAELMAFAPDAGHGTQRVARLDALVLPNGCAEPLDLVLQRGQRVALVGDNGSGKSTLLRVLAGQLPPRSGAVEVAVPSALLDQHLRALPPSGSALDALQQANPGAALHDLRTRLALLGLDAQRIERTTDTLSAGERLKAAMACALYADPAPGLLLLDEPGNALDLQALQVLEDLLQQYTATLVMASHDARLLAAMRPTHVLQVTPRGWTLNPWPDGAADHEANVTM